jgi:hypothetical protein
MRTILVITFFVIWINFALTLADSYQLDQIQETVDCIYDAQSFYCHRQIELSEMDT